MKSSCVSPPAIPAARKHCEMKEMCCDTAVSRVHVHKHIHTAPGAAIDGGCVLLSELHSLLLSTVSDTVRAAVCSDY